MSFVLGFGVCVFCRSYIITLVKYKKIKPFSIETLLPK